MRLLLWLILFSWWIRACVWCSSSCCTLELRYSFKIIYQCLCCSRSSLASSSSWSCSLLLLIYDCNTSFTSTSTIRSHSWLLFMSKKTTGWSIWRLWDTYCSSSINWFFQLLNMPRCNSCGWSSNSCNTTWSCWYYSLLCLSRSTWLKLIDRNWLKRCQNRLRFWLLLLLFSFRAASSARTSRLFTFI